MLAAMSRRLLVAAAVIAALGVIVLIAVVLGVRAMPRSATTPGAGDGGSEAALRLQAAIHKTFDASSLSEGLVASQRSGLQYEKLEYNAPDRVEMVNTPTNPLIIAVGRRAYVLNASGWGWSEAENQRPGAEKAEALGPLSLALRSRVVRRAGQTFTAVTSYRGTPSPKDRGKATLTIRTVDGFVSEARIVIHSNDSAWPDQITTIRITDIDSTPTISIPSDISTRSG
jgi:hypothetical protein